MDDMQIGWLSTGRDEAAIELLAYVHDGIRSGDIQAEIRYVFSTREDGENPNSDKFFDVVRERGIKLMQLSAAKYEPELRKLGRKDLEAKAKWRKKYHSEVMGILDDTTIDVLAGYMLILSPEMCEAKDCINLHPDLPGRYVGMWEEVIRQVIKDRAEEAGAMLHLATEILDRGPPITICKFPLRGDPWDGLWERGGNELFWGIRKAGVARELPLIYQTVKAFADGKIKIKDKTLYAGERPVEGGYNISEEVEEVVKKKSLGVLA